MKFLKRFFNTMSQEERWLSKSADMVELEQRQRMIDRGQAPWQRHLNNTFLFEKR